MEKLFRVNGKIFYNEDEANAYEADLKLKKEKEEAERKAAEEKKKKLTQYRETKLKEINEAIKKAETLILDYEKETGSHLIYYKNYCGGDTVVSEVRDSIDFAWDNVVDELLKCFRSK